MSFERLKSVSIQGELIPPDFLKAMEQSFLGEDLSGK